MLRHALCVLSSSLMLGSLSGCASLAQGTTQHIMPATVNDGDRLHTTCELKNEEGTWQAQAYVNTMIHRDGNEMAITCENPAQIGTTSVSPDFSVQWMALDALLDFCIISCTVDGINNAFYDYPQRVNIVMKDKPGASVPAPTSAAAAE